MIRKTRLAAAFALAAGLTAAGAALAQTQTQTGSGAPPPASAQADAPPTQSTLRWYPLKEPAIKPWDRDTTQQPYSVDPPPEGSSGIYLPAVVLGYAKSAAGCVVIGCADGPQVGGAPGPSSPGASSPASPLQGPSSPADEPPPTHAGPSDSH